MGLPYCNVDAVLLELLTVTIESLTRKDNPQVMAFFPGLISKL
jgi:hypothetical protein